LPLDRFETRAGRLEFTDVTVEAGIAQPRPYHVVWNSFDNQTQARSRIAGEESFTIPRGANEYIVADIRADASDKKGVSVYIRRKGTGMQVVGVERTW
ncbi:MAG: hypothetical protein ACRD96_00165, partial [Bryobacteraceae bacterium]